VSSDVGSESLHPSLPETAAVLAGFRAALQAARRYAGATAPNPPVGCAILDENGTILAVGAHERAGLAHAEAAALAQCAALGVMARAVTAVVTLEPCNHTGRTPPCTRALLASPIRDVWIACADPDPRVAGGGAAALAAAGARVRWLEALDVPGVADVLAGCRSLVVPFVHRVTTGRAWITVKQALTADGSMIPPAGQTVFTSPAALTYAHRIRRATDAIVTGVGTVTADAPGFDVRHVADHAGRAPRTLLVAARTTPIPDAWMEGAPARGFTPERCTDMAGMAARLGVQGVLWALVEGGPALLAALREGGLWDEWLTIRQRPDGSEQMTCEIRGGGVGALRALDPVEGQD